ncbi:MAG TPA: PH domain-containing protein [Candidatus Saccharimonadales bacterium]|nr:PH domain-containing protein [Candidatus Saccharimonadales bacterium]
MTTIAVIEAQLKKAGCNFRWWGRAEIRELANILMPDEIIAACVNGRYENGFALLCVTNHRLLLIDRKPMFLSLEDIRFDMITEMDYNARLLDSSVFIMTPNRKLIFRSWSQHRLRQIMNYTQQRVMEVRQQYISQQFVHPQQYQAPSMRTTAPLVGGLVMQGASTGGVHARPLNPYTKSPVMMRRRRYPKFY